MPDSVAEDRQGKRAWAVPGSRHDRLIRFAKIALPSGVGALLAILAVAPLEKEGDVSFILDKNQVESAEERMRVEAARYVGEDKDRQKFEILAQRAVQPSSDQPIVDIYGMVARLGLRQGPVRITADRARYSLDNQIVRVPGEVLVSGPDGYRLETAGVTVDLRNRRLHSDGGVEGAMRLGRFDAGTLRADLGERKIVLEGGARLKIVQGAVR